MASAVQQHSLLSPLPDLGSLKSGGNHCDAYGGLDASVSVCGAQTPTSSADPASERIDPVLLLSRPVEGFNHPRQHLFTDRLLGRFYEDSSLDAETRKTSKCLAGRLGTAGSNTTTRPNTTATAAPHLRSSHSPTATRRGRKRMQGSASARALGSSREPSGGGLAARKEQVQREILEQKALIEKLEGRVASLSGRGRRSTRPRASSGSPALEDIDGEASCLRQGADDRPATTPELESVAAGQEKDNDEEHRSTLKERPSADERIEGNHDLSAPGTARAGSQPSIKRTSRGEEVADHGPNARRDSCQIASRSTSHATPLDHQREEVCALTIQRNVRGIGRRKRFLTLQSAREELESRLQALVSAADTASAQQLQQQEEQEGKQPRIGEEVVGRRGAGEGKTTTISAIALRLLETSRKDGLAKPPFEILRAMLSGFDDLGAALASLPTAHEREEVGPGGSDARNDISADRTIWAATMAQSCSAAKEALDAVRDAVRADTIGVGESTPVHYPTASFSPRPDRDQQNSPAGSGRAAAVAMASARGGLLVCADDLPTYGQEPLAGGSSRLSMEPRKQNKRPSRDENRHPQSVPLRSLDVAGVAQLLRTHGFEEHVPGFITQSVDGVMLSDPNLCEADFVELGLGGADADAAHDCRLRMVSFFRGRQHDGVQLPLGADSPPLEEGLGPKPNERHAGDSIPDDRRGNGSHTGRKTKTGAGATVPDGIGSNQLKPSEEPSWRRGSTLVDHQNQRVLAQISLDPSETGREGAPTSASARDGRRLSVKLNQGVVITAGGLEAGLIDNAGDGLEATEVEAAAEEESRALAATPSGEGSRANTRRRRTSVGIPKVTLYREPGDGVIPESDGGLLPLPPDMTVTTADETINVFR